MQLGIVIPTLEEESTIARTLAAALTITGQVCVADGGSRDRTVEIAESMGALTTVGPASRGMQLNAGAELCPEVDLLVFLHADTQLPVRARGLIETAISTGAIGGGFLVHYQTANLLLKLGTHLINARTRLTRCPLGDQAQFVTRAAFDELGGFRSWKILEDLDFIRRLSLHGKISIIPDCVTTSSRRFESQGVVHTTAVNWLIWALYSAGVSPHRLRHFYRDIR